MQDKKLKWSDRGLLAYLLTLPDGWIINKSEIETHSDLDGRESLSNSFKRLEKAGYITRVKLRDKGKYVPIQYHVNEAPKAAI